MVWTEKDSLVPLKMAANYKNEPADTKVNYLYGIQHHRYPVLYTDEFKGLLLKS